MKTFEMQGVGFGYPGQAPLLYEVNLTINPGDRILLLGPNGSGKSTLALLLAGILTPSMGRLDKPKDYQVGIVFQESRNQIVGSTVEEDLAFGLTVRNVPGKTIRREVSRFLELFQLTHKRQVHPHSLSGGELRRLALAGVLIAKPDLLILDEPLAMLDYANQQQFLGFLGHELNPETAIFWIDHDLRRVRHCLSYYLLRNGSVVSLSDTDLNSISDMAESRITPAPLQPLEWRFPGKIRHSIWGPERIEYR